MRPYIVAALFGAGTPECQLTSNALIAASREHAASTFVAQAIQESNITQPLSGIIVIELDRQFLEDALRELSVTKAGGVSVLGQVVELRPKPAADVVAPEWRGGDGEPA